MPITDSESCPASDLGKDNWSGRMDDQKRETTCPKLSGAVHLMNALFPIGRSFILIPAVLLTFITLANLPPLWAQAPDEETKVFLGDKALKILSETEKGEVYRIEEIPYEKLLEKQTSLFKFKKAAMIFRIQLHGIETELEKAGKEKNFEEIRRLQQQSEQVRTQLLQNEKEAKEEEEKIERVRLDEERIRLEEVRKKCANKALDEFVCINNGRIGRHLIQAQGPALSREQLREITSIVIDPRTYDFRLAKLCTFEPGVIFRLHRGAEEMMLLLCFKCDELMISIDGKSKTEDFDFARPRLVTVVKQLFPNDPEIQALPLSRKE